MSKLLVIVESPAKAKTIRKYLGASYAVKASLGHVKDLPKSKMGVAVGDRFAPEYHVIPGKQKILSELVKSAGQAQKVYLALDPDREGEAIAWHIAEELKIDSERIWRVLFNEITKKGIEQGLANPQHLNARRYESQQARRILDRLVGYEISPILWKKVRRGLSAGRVQSVALRLIVDREAEIEAFQTKEYWNIEAHLTGEQLQPFKARYVGVDGKKVEVVDGESANRIKGELDGAEFRVEEVERKERRRAAPPPFITSRLQQEAARRFRFTAKRTMAVAQQLYEGIDIGTEGAVGLITYMRTDSVRISSDAVAEARNYIKDHYGQEFLPAKPNFFKSRKAAQEAHEAIRPTSVESSPEKVAQYLSRDQLKLYRLVWERFISSQMSAAVYDQTAMQISAGRHDLRATGAVLKFKGWLEANSDNGSVSTNGSDEDKDDDSGELPRLEKGDALKLVEKRVVLEQKFTQPPPRFSEGTLIRELEERGIGRPSTYAAIISTIQERRYVEKENGRFKPSELGRLVTTRLVKHFPRVLDVEFTALMEEALDEIEDGVGDWIKLLNDFYGPFHKEVERAIKEMEDVRDLKERTDEICDLCGKPMVIKWGRNGKFISCEGYPNCRNTKEIGGGGTVLPSIPIDVVCSECGSPMARKRGRFGDFLACTAYPKCKATSAMPTGIKCPVPGCAGELVERRTKRGRTFYGCSEYKRSGCSFVVWGFPVGENCPNCGAPFLVAAGRRNGGRNLKCAADGCGYKRTEE